MPFPFLAAAIAGSSALGAIGSAKAGRESTKASILANAAQERIADKNLAFQKETRDDTIARFDPFYQQGLDANAARQYEMGLGPMPEGYGGFQATPGYQFQLDEGQRMAQTGVAGQQGLLSGAALEALQARGQGLANQEYGNYYNRLTGLADVGQAAAGNQAMASQNAAGTIGNIFSNMGQSAANMHTNIGNAKSAATAGVFNNLSQGINQGLGAWQYMKGLE